MCAVHAFLEILSLARVVPPLSSLRHSKADAPRSIGMFFGSHLAGWINDQAALAETIPDRVMNLCFAGQARRQ